MRRLPPLNALKAFEACARHRSFTIAASELYVTQSAVSRQVRSLEDWMGVRLLDRKSGGLVLTPSGRALAPMLQAIFDRIEHVSRRLTHGTAELALRVPPTLALRWLMPRLKEFHHLVPGFEVALQVTAQDMDFEWGGSEAALVCGGSASTPLDIGSNFCTGAVILERLTPVIAPALLKDAALASPEDLAQFPLLNSSANFDFWNAWFSTVGLAVKPQREVSFEMMDATIRAAVHGFGVALANPYLVADELAGSQLVAPFPELAPTISSYFLVYSRDKAADAGVRSFRDWLVEAIRENWSDTGSAYVPAAAPRAQPRYRPGMSATLPRMLSAEPHPSRPRQPQ